MQAVEVTADAIFLREYFQKRYAAELRARHAGLAELRAIARRGKLTLIYAAKDELHNDAVVLRNVLLGR